MKVFCTACGKKRENFTPSPICSCGGIFRMEPDFKYREGKYLDKFPYLEQEVSLGETITPLLHFGDFDLKLEYFSPTYSYKDRGTKSMISWLKGNLPHGSRINEDSSGNAGASVAAYGAAAGFDVNIYVPEKTTKGKIKQIESYGAKIHRIPGSREAVSDACGAAQGYFSSHVYNPEFRDGMREISYEVFHQYEGEIPDYIFVPVSAGTLLLGLISGFKHLLDSGEIVSLPHFIAVQTEAVMPLCSRINGTSYDPRKEVQSIADALVSREPPLLNLMVEEIRQSGSCITVSESEIIDAREKLAGKGILVEYSSATVLAAKEKWKKEGNSLLIMSGNGLKNQ